MMKETAICTRAGLHLSWPSSPPSSPDALVSERLPERGCFQSRFHMPRGAWKHVSLSHCRPAASCRRSVQMMSTGPSLGGGQQTARVERRRVNHTIYPPHTHTLTCARRAGGFRFAARRLAAQGGGRGGCGPGSLARAAGMAGCRGGCWHAHRTAGEASWSCSSVSAGAAPRPGRQHSLLYSR